MELEQCSVSQPSSLFYIFNVSCIAAKLCEDVFLKEIQTNLLQLLAMDILALVTMKNAAKCDT